MELAKEQRLAANCWADRGLADRCERPTFPSGTVSSICGQRGSCAFVEEPGGPDSTGAMRGRDRTRASEEGIGGRGSRSSSEGVDGREGVPPSFVHRSLHACSTSSISSAVRPTGRAKRSSNVPLAGGLGRLAGGILGLRRPGRRIFGGRLAAVLSEEFPPDLGDGPNAAR